MFGSQLINLTLSSLLLAVILIIACQEILLFCRVTTFVGHRSQSTMSSVSLLVLQHAIRPCSQLVIRLLIFAVRSMQLTPMTCSFKSDAVNLNFVLFNCSHLHIHQWRAYSSGCVFAGNHQKQHVCCCDFCHCKCLSFYGLSLAQCCMPAGHVEALMLGHFLDSDCMSLLCSVSS